MTKARNIADIGSNDVLDTDANGVDVTGSITAETAVLSGTAPVLNYTDTDNSITAQIGSGTSDFNIATTTSHNIDIRTNNTRRMIVSANGDITMYKSDGSTAGMTFDASAGSMAVGTSNLPSDVSVVAADGIKFDVGTSDTTRIYAKSTGTGSYSLGSSGGSAIAFHRLADNSDEIGFETHHAGNNHTERMRLNYHGQLTLEGTGTPFDTTPSKNGLQLYYESDSGVATIASYSNGGGTQLDFQTNTGAGATDRIMTINTAGVVVNPDAEDKDFRVASDNNSHMLLVDGGSNRVGIGTASPNTDLDVFGGIRSTSSGGYNQITTTSIGDAVFNNNGNNWLTVKNGVPADAMRITSAGSVGISTSAPIAQSKLTVAGNSLSLTGSDGNFGAGGVRGMLDLAGGYLRMGAVNGGGSASGVKLIAPAGQEAVVLDSSGRVTTPYQPAFLAYHNSGDINYYPGDTLAYQNTHFNEGNCYNTSNSTFTAPIAGRYLFSANANGDYNSSYAGIPRAYWKINGSNVGYDIHLRGPDDHNQGLEQRSQTVVFNLSQGDTVKIVVGVNVWDLFGANSFMGYLLG